MATNMTNTLTATITATEDTTGNVPINRGLGNLAFDSALSEFVTYQTIPTGTTVITLPATKVYQVYVKNNDPANPLGVTYTPSGGGSNISPTLGPGEVFIIWQKNTNVATNAGITALSLTATANTLCEYFIGA